MIEIIYPVFTANRSEGKNIKPLKATGSLFNAPTILYVVDGATLKHQAVVKLIKNPAKPLKTIPIISRMFSKTPFSELKLIRKK
jgi:hypothetical protein